MDNTMTIKYMGTAAAEGWPALFCNCESCKKAQALGGKNIRTRSQVLVNDDLLVDFPADTYMHMLYRGFDLPAINHLLITHTHQDHLYIEELEMRYKWFANDVKGVLHLYGNDALVKKFDTVYKTNGGKPDPEHGMYGVVDCTELTEFETVKIGNYNVTAMLAAHAKTEKCFIYLIETPEKTLLYGNDTGYFPEATWEFLERHTNGSADGTVSGKKIDMVSMDCTCLRFKEGTNHMGLEDNLEVRETLKARGCVHENTVYVSTHFSHNGQMSHDEIEAYMEPHGFIVAYDGMVVSI